MIRKRRPHTKRQIKQWRWHLDEIFVKIAGEAHYQWRAIDHEGEVLEVYVIKTRDKAAALTFLKAAAIPCGSGRNGHPGGDGGQCQDWKQAYADLEAKVRKERTLAKLRMKFWT